MKQKLIYSLVLLALILAACGTTEPAPEVDAAQPTDIVLSVPTATGTPEDKTCTVTFYGAQYKLVPGQALKVDGVVVFENVDGECLDGEGNPADIVVTAPTGTATLAPVLPTARAMEGGFTDCNAFEAALMAKNMPSVARNEVGTKAHPIDYRGFFNHDICFGWAGYGNGAKEVIMDGTAVLNIGEYCGEAATVYVKDADPEFHGCVNGGWMYYSDAAAEAQLKLDENGYVTLENATYPYKYGLACGYKRNVVKLEDVKGYRWNGTLVPAPELECPYTLAQLLANDFGTDASVNSYGDQPYIQFKVEYQGTWYCGFRPSDVKFPKGTRVIEDWTQYPKPDLGFAKDSGEYGMTLDQGFCKGHPVDANNDHVAQKTFVTVYLTSEGFVPVTFPLK